VVRLVTLDQSDIAAGLRRVRNAYSGLAMKQIPFRKILLLPFSVLFAWASPTQTDSTIQVHWSEVCQAAAGSELTITTVNGKKVNGYCLKVDVDEIQLSNKAQGVIKITRSALSRVEMKRLSQKGHQFASLRETVDDALKNEAKWIFSPAAPLGIAAIPATLAWGIVASPFCLIGDLAHSGGNRKQQIQVI
jgi:hypothetical protein